MEESTKRKEIQDELLRHAPGLSKLPSIKKAEDLPFRYFEKLPDQVIQKLQDDPREAPSKPGWLGLILQEWFTKKYMVLAMASLLMAILVIGLWPGSKPALPEANFAELDRMEAGIYLMTCAEDLDEGQLTLLAGQFEGEDFMPLSDEDLDEVIEEYLYQQTTDIEMN